MVVADNTVRPAACLVVLFCNLAAKQRVHMWHMYMNMLHGSARQYIKLDIVVYYGAACEVLERYSPNVQAYIDSGAGMRTGHVCCHACLSCLHT